MNKQHIHLIKYCTATNTTFHPYFLLLGTYTERYTFDCYGIKIILYILFIVQ